MRVPIDNVQKQVEDETTQSVSGSPTYHSGSSQTVTSPCRLNGTTVQKTNTRHTSCEGIPSHGGTSQIVYDGPYVPSDQDLVSATVTSVSPDDGSASVRSVYWNGYDWMVNFTLWGDVGTTYTISYSYVTRDTYGSKTGTWSGFSGVSSISPTSGSGAGYTWSASSTSSGFSYSIQSTQEGNASYDFTVNVTHVESTPGYYSGVTRTINLGSDKYVTAVSVVSKSPSGATVTPTKTEHGASVYLYQNSSSTITATIKLEYYYYETVKEAKVKFNGVVYKHIKFNGQVVV